MLTLKESSTKGHCIKKKLAISSKNIGTYNICIYIYIFVYIQSLYVAHILLLDSHFFESIHGFLVVRCYVALASHNQSLLQVLRAEKGFVAPKACGC